MNHNTKVYCIALILLGLVYYRFDQVRVAQNEVNNQILEVLKIHEQHIEKKMDKIWT